MLNWGFQYRWRNTLTRYNSNDLNLNASHFAMVTMLYISAICNHRQMHISALIDKFPATNWRPTHESGAKNISGTQGLLSQMVASIITLWCHCQDQCWQLWSQRGSRLWQTACQKSVPGMKSEVSAIKGEGDAIQWGWRPHLYWLSLLGHTLRVPLACYTATYFKVSITWERTSTTNN